MLDLAAGIGRSGDGIVSPSLRLGYIEACSLVGTELNPIACA